MIMYCAGTFKDDIILYVGGKYKLTRDLSEAWMFSESQIRGKPVGVNGFFWLPVFLTDDLIDESDNES